MLKTVFYSVLDMNVLRLSTRRNFVYLTSLIATVGVLLSGCANLSNTEKGAGVGVGAGTVIGGAIGKATGDTAKGAIIGAVLGGTAGAIIGQQMDKQAAELEKELEDAEVQRVGEGIVVTFDSGILFGFDSAELRSEARSNLKDLAESLQGYDNTDALIVGHTDAVGTEAYNLQLSERRAASAADYLKSLGIASTRISIAGKGEIEPIATNETESGRQQNRRVEVAIYADKEYRDEVAAKNGQ